MSWRAQRWAGLEAQTSMIPPRGHPLLQPPHNNTVSQAEADAIDASDDAQCQCRPLREMTWEEISAPDPDKYYKGEKLLPTTPYMIREIDRIGKFWRPIVRRKISYHLQKGAYLILRDEIHYAITMCAKFQGRDYALPADYLMVESEVDIEFRVIDRDGRTVFHLYRDGVAVVISQEPDE